MRHRPIPAHNLKTTRSGAMKRRNIFWRWRRLFYLVTLVMVTGVAGVGFVVAEIELPIAPEPEDQTTFVCTAEVAPGQCNEDTAAASLHGEEDRVNVDLDEIPDVAVNAVIAAEDRDFFDHGGVDPVGITRAALSDIRGGSASRQGGSTITQQYVKNVYLTSDRTLTRKIREAVMAIKLEQEISKEQILENYLNTIYFGRGSYGIGAASRAYFSKDVSELSLPEAALLAGLIRSPQRAEPDRYPEEARRRRRTVLAGMLEEEMITEAERDRADEWPFDTYHDLARWSPGNGVEVKPDVALFGGEFFVEQVRKQLTDRYGNDAVFGGGLRIYTTLDRGLQEHAYRAVTETLDQPGDPAGSLVAIDDNGQVRAMMGGRDYGEDPLNLAVGTAGGGGGRQPGSTFKAFALAEAIKQGYSIESQVDTPSAETFPDADAGEDWEVRGGCCGGRATLVEATARSSNTAYAQLMIDLGPERVGQMAADLGVSADLGEEIYPSAVLGTASVSVMDMAAAYSTFANRGTQIEPRVITRVERADGTLVEEFTATRTTVLSGDQASRVTYSLEQVIDHGTGEAADIGRPAAGKTGTTQENRDAWFVGYTPTLTASVWMGYVDNREMAEVRGGLIEGGSLPADIWRTFMDSALEDAEPVDFMEPADLDAGRELDPGSG
jgi:penicillin-binding protein 1A